MRPGAAAETLAALMLACAAGVLVCAAGAAPCAAANAATDADAPARAATGAASAEEQPLDARLFAQGLEAQRAGRRDEAARLLRRVYTEFPSSPQAPAALLKVAEMIYPVTSWSQVGSASAQAVQQAGEILTRLTQKYRGAREAAVALVRLGYLGLEPAASGTDIDEACGRFATAAQIYPDSQAADDAFFASGMCEMLRGRAARASGALARLLQEHPDSPLAEEGLYRYGVALSLLDDPGEAMLALQQLRATYPESRFAPLALDRLTLLHRTRLVPALAGQPDGAGTAAKGGRKPAGQAAGDGKDADGTGATVDWTAMYRPDPDYGADLQDSGDGIRGISDISIDPQGLAVVASPRSQGVFRLDGRGHIRERIDHPGPDHVAAAEGLAVYISGREQIAINARNWSGADLKGAGGRSPSDYGPIAIDALGRVLMLDRRENAVLIYDRSRRLVGAVRPPAGKDGRFVDIASASDGLVYALDAKARAAVLIDQGREARRIDLGGLGTDDPAGLAVDDLGNLYVLDDRTGWVFVADPTGHRITVVRPPKEVAARLGDVSAVAVDPSGRLYLAGRKSGVVVRFQ
jgi:TolA-binding protein